MSNRFVRASKYRHVFGTCVKRDLCYDNLNITRSAHDSNLCKVNPRFISVNWQASGGAFCVIPIEQTGKMATNVPLFAGHKAPVLDTEFHPFNDFVIASGAEDCKIMIWSIPEEITENITTPVSVLSGHGKKINNLLFHPTASNLLASSSADLTLKLWDIEKGVQKQELLGHADQIQSMSWDFSGNLMATSARDKIVRIFDVRSGEVVRQGSSHEGLKGSRICWLGNSDRLITTGFSRMSDRQLYTYDSKDLSKKLKTENIDTASGILMPFYDQDSSMLYLAGKGDGNIRYYELTDSEPYSYYLDQYKSSEPQRGMAFLPKRALNVTDNEVARAFKVTTQSIEPISFIVPRKSDIFQHDLFPETFAGKASLTCDEFFEGKSAKPVLTSLENGFEPEAKQEFVSSAPPPEEESPLPTTEKEYRDGYYELLAENKALKNEIAQKNVRILQLEAQQQK